MGYPAGWVTDRVLPDADPRPSHLSRTQALKALGNAVVPQQGAAAIGLLEHTHDAQAAHG